MAVVNTSELLDEIIESFNTLARHDASNVALTQQASLMVLKLREINLDPNLSVERKEREARKYLREEMAKRDCAKEIKSQAKDYADRLRVSISVHVFDQPAASTDSMKLEFLDRQRKSRAAFGELIESENNHRKVFLTVGQCDLVLEKINEEKQKKQYKKGVLQILQDFERLINLAKEMNAISDELSKALVQYNGDPANLGESNKEKLEKAINNYSSKLFEFAVLYPDVQKNKNNPLLADLNGKLNGLFPIVKPGDTSFYEKLVPGFQRSMRLPMPMKEMLSNLPSGSPEYAFWDRICTQVKNVPKSAEMQMSAKVSSTRKSVSSTRMSLIWSRPGRVAKSESDVVPEKPPSGPKPK